MVKRLNTDDRKVLKALVKTIVLCPQEQKQVDDAYNLVKGKIREYVLKQWPETDMKVLRKYKLTESQTSFCVQLTPGGVEQFNFSKEDALEVPDSTAIYSGGYNRVIAVLDEKLTKLVNNWKTSKDLHTEVLAKKQGMYFSFIDSAKTFEQVLEVWPEAAQVSNQILSYLPSIVSDETISLIKKDVATRTKQG
jgi:hypothetical protein